MAVAAVRLGKRRAGGTGQNGHQRLGMKRRIGLKVHRCLAAQSLRCLNGIGLPPARCEEKHLMEHPCDAPGGLKAPFADREFPVRFVVVGDQSRNRRRHHLARADAHG